MADLNSFYGPNAGYVLDMFERFKRDPGSVDPRTRAFFEANGFMDGGTAPSVTAPPQESELVHAREAANLSEAIRERGHLNAHVDPLGSSPPGDPQLQLETHGITEEDLKRLPASVVGGPAALGADNTWEAIERLQSIYCGGTGYDYEHVHNPEERAWLREAAEKRRFRGRMSPASRRQLLDRLTQIEAFEQFLHRAFPAQKRFSIQGADMLVPLLDEAIHCQTRRGNREVLIGMAHRGRLAVLAHVLQKPFAAIIAQFEHKSGAGGHAPTEHIEEGWTGDVKYHLGAQLGASETQNDSKFLQVSITLTPNPSHLEFVNPVVEGMARAAQDRRNRPGPPTQDLEAALAVLIHGDAAFPGEGIVAETLNLSRLSGYQTGGTIHIIVNNQIGFTTNPSDGRSTLYASDLARGFEIPIVHVNADDPEACLAAARLACAYRDQFHKDFLIDLIGYRRWGHNEGDEPSFTQPSMYEVIRARPSIRAIWAKKLEEADELSAGEANGRLKSALREMEEARRQAVEDDSPPAEEEVCGELGDLVDEVEMPPASIEALQALNEELLSLPDDFTLHPTLARVMDRRRASVRPDAPDRAIDWAQAESLAFATILEFGIPIRLSGQDTIRGTFGQRHLTLHDAATGATHTALQALHAARASFALYNSPLSENAVLGFEYGYSVHSPGTLTLWEAQFGDFVNAAQVYMDEFIAAAKAKWRQEPGLVLLLPHGYEGQGPDHSSARLERFLQLAADDNLRVVNCTTAAQYFHLLRDQAALLSCDPRPLIVMTPKSLLRHPGAAARVEDLSDGRFQAVISDPHPDTVKRLLLCSGKVYYDLIADSIPDTLALVRVEELYPFPEVGITAAMNSCPDLNEIVWVQEEPENMGGWGYMEPRLRDLSEARARIDGSAGPVPVRYIGRPPRASPAEGLADLHVAEQARIVAEARGSEAEPVGNGPQEKPASTDE